MQTIPRLALICSLCLLAPVYADDIPVKNELASAIENAVKITGISINVSKLTPNDANINKVDGISVCAPEAKTKVVALQNALLKQTGVYRVYTTYAVYIRNDAGTFNYLPSDDPKVKDLIGQCKDIYVSVK